MGGRAKKALDEHQVGKGSSCGAGGPSTALDNKYDATHILKLISTLAVPNRVTGCHIWAFFDPFPGLFSSSNPRPETDPVRHPVVVRAFQKPVYKMFRDVYEPTLGPATWHKSENVEERYLEFHPRDFQKTLNKDIKKQKVDLSY